MAFLIGENKPRTWIQIAAITGVLAIPLVSVGNKQSTAAATQVPSASQAQKKVVLKNLGMV